MKSQEYYLENHSTNYAAMLAILHDIKHLSKYGFTQEVAITTEITKEVLELVL